MSEFNIEVEGGKTVKLKTAGKYCDRNIVVTAKGGGDTEAAYQQGVTDGKQAEWNSFWDSMQNYGERRTYRNGFAETAWIDREFNPKYPIIATGDASYMFDGCQFNDIDFVEQGIVLDVSGANGFTYLFRQAKGIKRLGVIDCTGCTNLNRLFYGTGVHAIDKFIVSENTTYSVPFEYTYKLQNITIEGVIGNSIKFNYCSLLSKASIESIVNALSPNAEDQSLTLSLSAVLAAFNATQENIAENPEWLALTQPKGNWNILLV